MRPKYFALQGEECAGVCYGHALGGYVVETVCGDMATAERIAARMNWQAQAAAVQARQREAEARAAAVLGRRQAVRYFEPDAFA